MGLIPDIFLFVKLYVYMLMAANGPKHVLEL